MARVGLTNNPRRIVASFSPSFEFFSKLLLRIPVSTRRCLGGDRQSTSEVEEESVLLWIQNVAIDLEKHFPFVRRLPPAHLYQCVWIGSLHGPVKYRCLGSHQAPLVRISSPSRGPPVWPNVIYTVNPSPLTCLVNLCFLCPQGLIVRSLKEFLKTLGSELQGN